MERAALGWGLDLDTKRGKKLRKVEWDQGRQKQRIQYAGAQRKNPGSGQVWVIFTKAKASRGIGGDLGLAVNGPRLSQIKLDTFSTNSKLVDKLHVNVVRESDIRSLPKSDLFDESLAAEDLLDLTDY